MKKFLKLLPALIVICCLIFLAFTVVKVNERAEGLNAQIADLEAANAALTEEKAALQADLDAANAAIAEKDEALAAKEIELADANTRLEHAEATLNDALVVVQSILEGLDNDAAEEAEAPAEEPAEVTEETEAPAEAPVEEAEAPVEENEVAPVEEAAEVPAEEAPVEEAAEEASAE